MPKVVQQFSARQAHEDWARGGHGFRVIEDLVLLEIKQGPYLGDATTKERF